MKKILFIAATCCGGVLLLFLFVRTGHLKWTHPQTSLEERQLHNAATAPTVTAAANDSSREQSVHKPDFLPELLEIVKSGSEDKVIVFLDELTLSREMNDDNDIERLREMIFRYHFQAMDHNCDNLHSRMAALQMEKQLKEAWFTARGMSAILKEETVAAERKMRELADHCNEVRQTESGTGTGRI
jgi:hypothetical protein